MSVRPWSIVHFFMSVSRLVNYVLSGDYLRYYIRYRCVRFGVNAALAVVRGNGMPSLVGEKSTSADRLPRRVVPQTSIPTERAGTKHSQCDGVAVCFHLSSQNPRLQFFRQSQRWPLKTLKTSSALQTQSKATWIYTFYYLLRFTGCDQIFVLRLRTASRSSIVSVQT